MKQKIYMKDNQLMILSNGKESTLEAFLITAADNGEIVQDSTDTWLIYWQQSIARFGSPIIIAEGDPDYIGG